MWTWRLASTVSRPVSKATSWLGQAARPFAEVQALGGRAVLPGLDVPGYEHALAAERSGVQPAEHAPASAVGQDVLGEQVLPDPGRGEQDALGLLLGPGSGGGGLGDLVLEGVLQGRRAELVLAEEAELAAVLEAEEVGQAVGADALGSGRGQQGAVDGVKWAGSSRRM